MLALFSCCRLSYYWPPRRHALWHAMLWCLFLGLVPPALATDPPPEVSLVVADAEGEPLVEIDLQPGMRWCLGWNHSVKKFPVHDCYRYLDGRMVLERSHQPDFAAGLGHSLGRGEQVSDGEGGYWIENIDEPVPNDRYALRVGSLAVDHRLLWQENGTEHKVSLSEMAAGERVILQLRKPDDV